MRPIIGVTSNFGLDKTSATPRPQSYLLAAYTDAVFAAGGLPHPVPVPPDYDDALLDALLGGFDGLIFTGGLDVHPREYGQGLHPQTKPMPERRERFELDLFRRADAAGVPILAICLGHQVAHVARGGQLIQHVDDLSLTPAVAHHAPDGGTFHPVRIAPDSRLAQVVGATAIEVNSRHHQAVDHTQSVRALRPVAYAPDGILEGAEDCAGRFLLSVQWHPEDLIDRPEHLRLFEALVTEATAGRPRPGGATCPSPAGR
jgi:putative glutamine amidotransferase